jgi:signal transduction histidine kinase
MRRNYFFNTPIKTTRCLAAASLLIVFIIDIVTPPTFVADILYLCCSLLVFRESPRTILFFSIGACLLIVADTLLFDLKLNLGITFWANRGMSILAIIITSNLAIRFRKLNHESSLKDRQHLEALREILFITSHRVRKPLANIVGLTDLINADNTILTADDLKKRCHYLSFSAKELDEIIKELNDFIEQSEHEEPALDLFKPVVPVPESIAAAKLGIVA